MPLFKLNIGVILAAFGVLVTPVLCVFGDATWYRPNGGQGACGAPVANSDVSVALAPEHYKDGELCWKRIGIWSDGNYIDATVADCCPTCGPDDIDLTESAFQHLASLDTGRMKVSWEVL